MLSSHMLRAQMVHWPLFNPNSDKYFSLTLKQASMLLNNILKTWLVLKLSYLGELMLVKKYNLMLLSRITLKGSDILLNLTSPSENYICLKRSFLWMLSGLALLYLSRLFSINKGPIFCKSTVFREWPS